MNADFLINTGIFLLGITGLVIFGYVISSGRILVRKQTLDNIFDQIKELRHDYSEENELLVTNLQILTSRKSILANERKDAILNFFTVLNEWVWDGLNISISDYNHTNYQEITTKLAKIRDNYNHTNISFGRLQLVINDDALIKNGYETIMETLRLHHFMENTLKTYQKTLSWEKTLLEKITSKDYDFFKLSPDMKSFYERQAIESDSEKKKILEGYNDRHWDLFKPVVEKLNEFREMTKESLNEIKREMPNGLAEGKWSTLK